MPSASPGNSSCWKNSTILFRNPCSNISVVFQILLIIIGILIAIAMLYVIVVILVITVNHIWYAPEDKIPDSINEETDSDSDYDPNEDDDDDIIFPKRKLAPHISLKRPAVGVQTTKDVS